jgi:hypothetical protein
MQMTEQIGFKVEPELRIKIEAVARAERRTVAGLMRYISAQYVEYLENGHASARQ